MTDVQHPSSNPPPDPESDRVDSWKEIASYLKRDESTVQRWEKREGMPVHRHLHDKRGSVYAFRTELDGWWQSRRSQLEPRKTIGDETAAHGGDRYAAEVGPNSRRHAWWIGIVAAGVALSASLVAWKWLPLSGAAVPSSPSPALVRLTSTSGVSIDPALSPDGSLLAYASDRGGSDDLDIWVQPTTGEKPTRVTAEPGDEVEPSFSPDGATIVFVKAQTGGLYTVGAVGGEPRLLASALRAHRPRFSPDGRFVAYWTGLPEWSIPGAAGATGGLFVVPTGGGPPRELAAGFADNRHPIWSPDGDKILFLGQSTRDPTHPTFDWYVVAPDGGQPAHTGATDALRQAGVTGLPIPGGWNEGGVIFTTYDQGPSNVWQLAVSTSTARVVGAPRRLTFGTAMERSPSVSLSGRVVFTSVVENVDVWRVPLDPDSGVARGPIERVTDNAAIDRMMNVSDDGRTMAFASSRTGRNEVWLRDLQTGRERQITNSNAEEGRVSRDGSLVAVREGGSQERSAVVPVSGGAQSAVCDDCRINDWSPDDTRWLIRKDQTRLVVRERRSNSEIEVASHPTWQLNQGRFSPDGRWVVFHASSTPSLRQIYAVPTFATGPVPVGAWTPIVSDFGMQPSWSPDGSAVYHISLRDGVFCAWLQRLNPKTMQPIGSPVAVQHFHQPRLRPVAGAASTNYVAGGYLYVTLTETAANIWMLDPKRTAP